MFYDFKANLGGELGLTRLWCDMDSPGWSIFNPLALPVVSCYLTIEKPQLDTKLDSNAIIALGAITGTGVVATASVYGVLCATTLIACAG